MRRSACACLLLFAAVSSAAADAELTLEDGRILRGVDVERKGDEYLLELESGDIVSIPLELVVRMSLSDGEKGPVPGLVYAEPEVLAGPPEPVRPPRKSEQLEVLGEPARFRAGVVNPRWKPRNAWGNVSARGTLPEPTRWSEGPISSFWLPESCLDDRDVLAPRRVSWRESIIDPFWYPADGFAKQRASWGSR